MQLPRKWLIRLNRYVHIYGLSSCHLRVGTSLERQSSAEPQSRKLSQVQILQQLCEQWIELSEELINCTFHETRKSGEIER
jgi:hypothetical protein